MGNRGRARWRCPSSQGFIPGPTPSFVQAKYLARPDSASIGIVACGVQGRSNLEALACLFAVQRVVACDLRPDIAMLYAREMGERLGLHIEPVKTLAKAVGDMEVVVTSRPILRTPKASIEPGWLAPGRNNRSALRRFA